MAFPISATLPTTQQQPGVMVQPQKLNRDKEDKVSVKKTASAFAGTGPAAGGLPGPKTLDANRDSWANALQQMGGVYTPDPITAIAKVAGMGLAGYGQTKAIKQKEKGEQAFREKLANALSGQPQNTDLTALMFDPYADQSSQAFLREQWQRANPTEDELAQRRLREQQYQLGQIQLDQADDPQYEYVERTDGVYAYDKRNPNKVFKVEGIPGAEGKSSDWQQFERPDGVYAWNKVTNETKKIAGIPGKAAEGTSMKPFEITKEATGDQVYKNALVVQSTLNSMFSSLSDPSAISDLDFVNGVAKILDPNSVVREAEGRQVIESQSIPAQLLGNLNKLANGESALDPATRVAMYRLAQRRGGETVAQAQAALDQYSKIAKANNFDPSVYVPSLPNGPKGTVRDRPQNFPQMPPQQAAGSPSGVAGVPSPGGAATTPAPTTAAPPAGSAAPPPAAGAPPPVPTRPAGIMPQSLPGTGPRTGALPPILPGMGGSTTLDGTMGVPPDLQQVIPAPLFQQLQQEAAQAGDPTMVERYMDMIRQNPAILQEDYPQFFGGQ